MEEAREGSPGVADGAENAVIAALRDWASQTFWWAVVLVGAAFLIVLGLL